jgi:hypothetical protein
VLVDEVVVVGAPPPWAESRAAKSAQASRRGLVQGRIAAV